MARSKLHVDDKDDNQCYECGQKGHWYEKLILYLPYEFILYSLFHVIYEVRLTYK